MIRAKRKVLKVLSILLTFCMVLQMFPLTMFEAVKVKAAGGTEVIGPSGTVYALKESFVKELDINVGEITITDSGYTQTNGASENWSAEDPYVIKGQGSSANRITISNTNYPVTLYLLETQWKRGITLNLDNNVQVKIIVLGNVVNTATDFLTINAPKRGVEILGYDENSYLTVDSLFYGNTRAKSVTLSNLKLKCNKITQITTTIGDLLIKNTVLNQTSIVNKTVNVMYGFSATNRVIEDSVIDNIYIAPNADGECVVRNSRIKNLSFIMSGTVTLKNTLIENSTIDTLYPYQYTTLTNSVVKEIGYLENVKSKYTLTDSTIASIVGGYQNATSEFLFVHSSFNSNITGWNLPTKPKDHDGKELVLKKVRFRDYPSTYILTTFEDGHTSKLLTDVNGYLYPYVPADSSRLEFVVTDETGTTVFDSFEYNFSPSDTDDTVGFDADRTAKDSLVDLGIDVANSNIEYSFDKIVWKGATVDDNGIVTIPIPDKTSAIYIRFVGIGKVITAPITQQVVGEMEDAIPNIYSQSPASVTAYTGMSYALFVKADPYHQGGILEYNWYEDGNLLSDCTSPILNFEEIDQDRTGTYVCVVTERDWGSTSSAPISLTVTDVPTGGNEELQELVDSLQAQVSSLTSQLEAANSSIASLQGQVDSLSETIGNLNSQISGLQSDLSNLQDASEAEIAGLNSQISTLTAEKSLLQSQLDLANADKLELQGIIDGLNSQLSAYATQISTLQGLLDASEDDNAALREQISQLQSQISGLQSDISTLNQQISELTSDNLSLQSQLSTANSTISDLQNQILQLLADKGTLQDQITVLEGQISTLTGQLQDEIQKNTTLQNQINSVTTEMQEIADALGASSADKDTILAQINSLKNQITLLTSQLSSSNEEIINLNSQISTLNGLVSSLQSKLEAALDSLSEYEGVELQERINNIKSKVNELTSLNSALAIENADLVSQLSAANATISLLQAQIDTLTEEKGNLLSQIAELESQVSILTAQLSGEQQDVIELQNQITELQGRIQDIIAELGVADKDAIIAEIVSLKEQITNLTNQLSISNSTIANLLEQISNMNNTISSLQTTITSGTADLEGYDGVTLLERISSIKTRVNELESANQALTENNNSLTSQLTTANNTITSLLSQISDLEEANTTLQERITNLEGQIIILGQELSDEQQKNSSLQTQITELQDKIQDIVSELGVANKDSILEEIANLKSQITNLTTQLSNSNSTISGLLDQITILNSTITNLQNQITNGTLDLEGYDGDTLIEKITSIKSKVVELTNENQTLVESNNSLTSQLATANSTITTLLQQISELEEDKTTLQDRVTNLENQVTDLTQELLEEKQKNSLLQSQIVTYQNELSELAAQVGSTADKDAILAKMVELQGQVTNLSDQLNSSNNTIVDLNNQITILNSTILNLQTELDAAKDSLSDQIGTTLQERIDALKNAYSILLIENSTLSSENANLYQQVIDLTSTIADLTTQLGNANQANVVLTQQLEEANTQITSLQEQLSLEIAKGVSLQTQIDTLLQNVADLQYQLDNVDTDKVELLAQIISLQGQISSLTTQLTTANNQITLLTHQIADLNVTITQLQTALNDALSSLSEYEGATLQEKINDIKTKQGDIQKDLETAAQVNTELNDQLNTAKDSLVDLQTQIEVLNGQLADKDEEIARLIVLLNEKNAEISNLQTENTVLRSENSALHIEIEDLKEQIRNLKAQISTGAGNSNSNTSVDDSTVRDLQSKLDQALADLAEAQKKLKEAENTITDIPEKSVVIHTDITEPVSSVIVAVGEDSNDPVTEKVISAKDGWEIAKDLNSDWVKEIEVSDLVGNAGKHEIVKTTILAREEEKPQEVYPYTLDVQKPVTLPDFNMSKDVYLGSKFNLNLSLPDGANGTYSTSNPNVAKVNKNGTITPVKEGTAKITGKVTGIETPYQFTVNVNIKNGDLTTLNLNKDKMASSSDSPILTVYKLVEAGKKTKLSLTGDDNAYLSYHTSDSNIVTVGSDGTLTGKKKGSATVTATITQNGIIYTYIIKVRVTDGTADPEKWDYLIAS